MDQNSSNITRPVPDRSQPLLTNLSLGTGQSPEIISLLPTTDANLDLDLAVAAQFTTPRVSTAHTTFTNPSTLFGGHREGWEIPVVIGLAVLLMAILVILLVTCIICRRRLSRARSIRSVSKSQSLSLPVSSKDPHLSRPQGIGTSSASDSNASRHSERFESDFTNAEARPWSFDSIQSMGTSGVERSVPMPYGSREPVEMVTLAVDDGNCDTDIHPDYLYDDIMSTTQRLKKDGDKKISGATPYSKTEVFMTAESSRVDKVNDVYSVVARGKSKSKMTNAGSNGHGFRPKQISVSYSSGRASSQDLEQFKSDKNIGTKHLRKTHKGNYLHGDNIGRYETHANLKNINTERNYFEDGGIYDDHKLHANKHRDCEISKGDSKFHDGFGTSVTHILGRKPRFHKCVSFDEVENLRGSNGRSSGKVASSEWPPLTRSMSYFEEQKAGVDEKTHNQHSIPSDSSKTITEPAESRNAFKNNRGSVFPEENEKVQVSSVDCKPQPVISRFSYQMDAPKHRNLSTEKDSSSIASHPNHSPSSLSFPFQQNTTERILVKRQILKTSRSSSSLFPHDVETGNALVQDRRKTGSYQNVNSHSERVWKNEKLQRNIIDQHPHDSQQIHSPDGNANNAFRLRGQMVPKITISNQADSDESSDNERDILNTVISSDELELSQKLYSDLKTVIAPQPNVSCSDETYAEKLRRFSAPNMPNRSPQLTNISPAFQRRIVKSMSSDGLGGSDTAWGEKYTGSLQDIQRSWSDDCYELIRRTDSNDKDKAEYFKNLINARYEALFGTKNSDHAFGHSGNNFDGVWRRLNLTDHPSPRTVKRRSAAMRQKKLSRESSPTHSPFNSIDGDAANFREKIEYLKVPDSSQWNFLYDNVSLCNEISFSNNEKDKTKLPCRLSRPELAEGTDGADSDESSSNVHKSRSDMNLQHPHNGSVTTLLNTTPSGRMIPERSYSRNKNVFHTSSSQIEKNTDIGTHNNLHEELANDETHIYSEIGSPKFDENGNDSSGCSKIPDSCDRDDRFSTVGDDKNPAESCRSEPIYESITNVNQLKPRESIMMSFSDDFVTKQNSKTLENVKRDDTKTESLHQRKPKQSLVKMSLNDESSSKNRPTLPSFRPTTQMPLLSKTKPPYLNRFVLKNETVSSKSLANQVDRRGCEKPDSKRMQPRLTKPRSLTTPPERSSIKDKMPPSSTNAARMTTRNQHYARTSSTGDRDKSIFQSSSPSAGKHVVLKKAHKFSKKSDKTPDFTHSTNVYHGSEFQQDIISRGRAYSSPTQGANNTWDGDDPTQFRSTAGNVILEHSTSNDSLWLGISKRAAPQYGSKETTTPSTIKTQPANLPTVSNGQKKSEKVKYFGLNQTVLANLQKSSV
ncbi:hypothetical protein ElyMa_006161100 [Elysia marginata]|uniref:Uncharacterized protein n=1 Tax=Elysia marginata TaxID=1093978 RepID=A0AAV4H031_9GAST|nr:hypothetical protein ElyMa_006161100 [Elysia marginata]